MKATLTHGAELDFLTAEELDEILQRFKSGFLRPAQTVRLTESLGLDGSGNTTRGGLNVALPIFRVPAGYHFRLHRLGVFPDGYTFGVPYTSGSGYLEIHQAGMVEDGLAFTAPGLPAVWSAGTADGILYSNDQAVSVLVNTGPASKTVAFKIQGTLEPITGE